MQQMTQGYNIVADRWAGALNLIHTLTHPKTQTYTKSKTLISPPFNSMTMMDQWMDGPTDLRTDKASFQVARPQLKTACKRQEKLSPTNGWTDQSMDIAD